jgi:hypothetical protein
MCNENKIEPALNKLLLRIIITKGIILFFLNDVLSLGICPYLASKPLVKGLSF